MSPDKVVVRLPTVTCDPEDKAIDAVSRNAPSITPNATIPA
jgi:hypothetical protein